MCPSPDPLPLGFGLAADAKLASLVKRRRPHTVRCRTHNAAPADYDISKNA